MEPITGIRSGAVYPAAGVREAEPVTPPREEGDRTPGPVTDEYVPEEKREATGLYWQGRDEDGSPKIFFDAPREQDPPEDPGAPEQPEGPEKGDEAEQYTGSTDKVDREIERLKRKREELEAQISREADSAKTERLEKELARVERELRQKDNDAYRRQHMVIS